MAAPDRTTTYEIVGVRRDRDEEQDAEWDATFGDGAVGAGARRVAARLDFGQLNHSSVSTHARFFKKRETKRSGGLPLGAKVRTSIPYSGSKVKIGSILLLIGKQESDLLFMTMTTTPWNIGKSVIEKMNKKSGKTFKQRHEGIEWAGIDQGNILAGNQFLHKASWFANLGTCDGNPQQLFALIKDVATEMMEAKLQVDKIVADVQLTDDDVKSTSNLMNALIGKTDDSDSDDTD